MNMSAGPAVPLLPDAIASGMVPGLGRGVAGPLQLAYGPDLQARVRVPQKDADGASGSSHSSAALSYASELQFE